MSINIKVNSGKLQGVGLCLQDQWNVIFLKSKMTFVPGTQHNKIMTVHKLLTAMEVQVSTLVKNKL